MCAASTVFAQGFHLLSHCLPFVRSLVRKIRYSLTGWWKVNWTNHSLTLATSNHRHKLRQCESFRRRRKQGPSTPFLTSLSASCRSCTREVSRSAMAAMFGKQGRAIWMWHLKTCFLMRPLAIFTLHGKKKFFYETRSGLVAEIMRDPAIQVNNWLQQRGTDTLQVALRQTGSEMNRIADEGKQYT